MANMKSIVTDLMLALESVDLPKSFMDKVSNGDIFDDFDISEKFDKFKVLEYIKSKMKTAKVSDDIISKFESEYKSNSENFNKKNYSFATDAKKIVSFINENNLKDSIKDIGNHPLYEDGDDSELLTEILGSDLFKKLKSLNVDLDFVLELMNEYDIHGGKVGMDFSRKSNFAKSVDKLGLGSSGIISDINSTIEELVGDDTWFVDRIRESNGSWIVDASNDNGKKHKIFYMVENDIDTIEEVENDESNEDFNVIYVSTDSNFSRKSNFAGNKSVNMSISKEFVPSRENYTQFGYIKEDDEITINKGSKKLVLKGADAIEWIDAYWVAKYMDISMNYSRKSNFANTMDEWYKRKLESLKSAMVVHPDNMKDYYDSGKLKVGDYIYIIGDPATEDMVGYVTSSGSSYLIDKEGTECPNIELMMIDSYSLDEIDIEKISGKSDDFIKKEIKKLIPYKYSNKESISNSKMGLFYFGRIFVTTKSVYNTMYEEIVEDFISRVKDQDNFSSKSNFSLSLPIRSR